MAPVVIMAGTSSDMDAVMMRCHRGWRGMQGGRLRCHAFDEMLKGAGLASWLESVTYYAKQKFFLVTNPSGTPKRLMPMCLQLPTPLNNLYFTFLAICLPRLTYLSKPFIHCPACTACIVASWEISDMDIWAKSWSKPGKRLSFAWLLKAWNFVYKYTPDVMLPDRFVALDHFSNLEG